MAEALSPRAHQGWLALAAQCPGNWPVMMGVSSHVLCFEQEELLLVSLKPERKKAQV